MALIIKDTSSIAPCSAGEVIESVLVRFFGRFRQEIYSRITNTVSGFCAQRVNNCVRNYLLVPKVHQKYGNNPHNRQEIFHVEMGGAIQFDACVHFTFLCQAHLLQLTNQL